MSGVPTQPETALILGEIAAERMRQEVKWAESGPPHYGRWGAHDDQHGPRDWSSFIVEHLGRAVRAAEHGDLVGHRDDSYRQRMVSVAALAVAAIEALDRNREASA